MQPPLAAGAWGGGQLPAPQPQLQPQPSQLLQPRPSQEDDLLLPAVAPTVPCNISAPLLLSVEDLDMDPLHEVPLLPMRTGNLSCSDLPSTALQPPSSKLGSHVQAGGAMGPGQALFAPQLQQPPSQPAANLWQPPQQQQQDVAHPFLHPATYQRSISYGDTLLPQPARAPQVEDVDRDLKHRLKMEGSPDAVVAVQQQEALPAQQQQQQARPARGVSRPAAGARKKRSPAQPKLDVAAAGMKTVAAAGAKAGAKAKQPRAPG